MPAADAARRLGCSAQTVVNMIKDQRLPGMDRGTGTRPRWLALREAVEQQTQRHRGDRPLDHDLAERELARAYERIRQLEEELKGARVLGRHLLVALRALVDATQQQLNTDQGRPEDNVPFRP
jgi:hypothetical protein